MNTDTKNLLFELMKTSIDCVDEAGEELQLIDGTEMIAIPKVTYDCFRKIVDNLKLEIAKVSGFGIHYNEETDNFHYIKMERKPRKVLRDSKHAYRQGYLWNCMYPWNYVNLHVYNSSNYREFGRGWDDAEFNAKANGFCVCYNEISENFYYAKKS